MKIILQLLVFLFVISNVCAQDKQLKLEITSIKSNKNSITINVEVINITDKEIVVYIPDLLDICSGLMHIRIINTRNNWKHEFYRCTSWADLDHIELNSKNSRLVNSNDRLRIKYSFLKKNITPYLKKNNTYKIIVGWYFKSVYIKTDLKNYFNDDVESNYILFKNN
jgi:hypothetical protein